MHRNAHGTKEKLNDLERPYQEYLKLDTSNSTYGLSKLIAKTANFAQAHSIQI